MNTTENSMVVMLIIFNLDSNFLDLITSCVCLDSLYLRESFISIYEIRKAAVDINSGTYDIEFVCMTYPANNGMLPHDIANQILL